jgi:glycosyltransferase involved in cell wall biosynthesis
LRQWAPDVLLLNDSHAIALGGSAALACRPVRPLRLAMRHVIFRVRSPMKLRSMSDAIICVSEAARQSVLRAGIPRERTEVIYGGCETPTADPQARAWAESELGIASSAPLLVCVGNLLECKGVVPLIEAAALVHAQIPDAHIVIAGEGLLRERIERRIEELGLKECVHLLGFRTDADRWLAAASVVLHPSLQEGLSLVLIQAQKLGKLIVSTGVGGSAEVLGLNEDQPCLAWLATPGDPFSLAEQIRLATDAWRLGPEAYALPLERAASRARIKFDIDRNVSELIELAHRLRQSNRKPFA